MTRPPIFRQTLAAHGLAEESVTRRDLIPHLIRMLNAHLCPRCDNGTGATCAACLAEIQHAEREAEARTVMTALRGMFDPMTGRPVGGGW